MPKLRDLDSRIMSEDPMPRWFKPWEMDAFERGFNHAILGNAVATISGDRLQEIYAMGVLVGQRCLVLQSKGVL